MALVIKSHRDVYNIREVESTMTVGELINYLERFNSSEKVIVSHDGGYMYSGVYADDFVER